MGYKKKVWAVAVLVTVSFVRGGIGHARPSETQAKEGAKQVLAPNINKSQSEKALGPQPEPPDKPAPGSGCLGPQQEPPDRI